MIVYAYAAAVACTLMFAGACLRGIASARGDHERTVDWSYRLFLAGLFLGLLTMLISIWHAVLEVQ